MEQEPNTEQLDLLPDAPPPAEMAEPKLPKSDYESAYERIVNAHRKSRGLTNTFDTRKGIIEDEPAEQANLAESAESEEPLESEPYEDVSAKQQVEEPEDEAPIVAAEEDAEPEPAPEIASEEPREPNIGEPPAVRTHAHAEKEPEDFNPIDTRIAIRQAYDEADYKKALELEDQLDQYRIREAKRQFREESQQAEYSQMAEYYVKKYPFLGEKGDPAKYEPVNAMAQGFVNSGMTPAAALKRAVETMESTWRPQEVVPQEKVERMDKMEARKERKRQTVVQIPTATARGAAPPEQKPMSNQEFIAFMRRQRTGSQ